MAVVGLIHVSESSSSDPLTTVMASRAFAAIARAVLYVAVDPNDSEVRPVELVKSNLSTSEPAWAFQIVGESVPADDGRVIDIGRIEWIGEVESSVHDFLDGKQSRGRQTRVADAVEWLRSYLKGQAGEAESAAIPGPEPLHLSVAGETLKVVTSEECRGSNCRNHPGSPKDEKGHQCSAGHDQSSSPAIGRFADLSRQPFSLSCWSFSRSPPAPPLRPASPVESGPH